ncbi:MAG: acyl--CoA ligase, partial [Clostridia bacterium]|nr:acyl--CoA ligase [Clostridia bacterium]
MNSTEKRLRQNLRALKDSGRSFRDMYEILFCGEMQDLVMCETALPLRTREMTYGDAERAIGRLAAALYGAIGACDRYVGLWGANSAEWLVAFWAILRSGNRPYPMDPQSSDTETAIAFQSLDIRAVLCVTKDAPQAFGDGVEVLDASVLLSRGASLPELPCELPFGEYVALGKEKLCVWRGADLAYRILDAERAVKENPMLIGDPKTGVKHLAILPFYHIFGLGAVYLQFAFFGATFVFPAGDAPDVLLYTARRCEI